MPDIRIENLSLINRFSDHLEGGYSRVNPTPISNPEFVDLSPAAARLLNIEPHQLTSRDALAAFSGQSLLANSKPLAQVYSGHQFGGYTPQLGDGRAILLGEAMLGNGETWDIQLKGAGATPYSRMGDGRAVLRSSIREYLASEAMAALNIPTTRALALLSGDDKIYREEVETSAVVVRLARSHIRFGHFEYYFYTQQPEMLQKLIDYVIQFHYPHLLQAQSPVFELLKEVCQRTARLIAKWQAVGFCHGVMNTDNMSILGDTLDYGPYAFMDGYQPDYVCNHSDHTGRYAFDAQPGVALWNLNCLGHALSGILSKEEITQALATYEPELILHFSQQMRAKLGFQQPESQDNQLLDRWLTLMKKHQADYTLSFRYLCNLEADHDALSALFEQDPELDAWLTDYQTRLSTESITQAQRQTQMEQVNPLYVLRNHLAQQAIEKAQRGDYSEVARLREILSNPYQSQPNAEDYAQPAPAWSQHLCISCSS